MSDAERNAAMQATLARLRRRRRGLHVLQHAGQGLLIGTILALLTAAVAAIVQPAWFQIQPWLVWLWPPGSGVVGALVGLLRPVDTLHVARALDQAAGSADRFASAWQLRAHRRHARAALVMDDALARIRPTAVNKALPLRTPRELKWVPVTALVLAVLLWYTPGPRVVASPVPPPEVTAEEWAVIQDELQKQLDELPKPQTDEEKEIADELARLASLLKENPVKKDVLARISALHAQWQKRREQLGTRDVSMRQAARAVGSSAALQQFASLLRQGEYLKAAEELKKLAEQLREDELKLSAADFEAAATDLDQLAIELADHAELSECCRSCSSAACSMNREKLAEALKRLSECLGRNCDDLRRCDSLCRACALLDLFKRRVGQCGQCGDGSCSAFVQRNNKKGGLKAGWGTADNWTGGSVEKQDEQRLPVLAEARERAGRSTSFSVVSKEERARSAQEYRQLYAELVQKAEADLELESVPVAYRAFLRRYFNAIRPPEDTGERDE
jgi:hypothetical protein